MITNVKQLFTYMEDSKFYEYFQDLDSYFQPTKSETMKMIRLSQMSGNYKNDLFKNTIRPIVNGNEKGGGKQAGRKTSVGQFDSTVCADLPYMSLIRVLSIKSQQSRNLKKHVQYGFVWGEDKKNCNQVICTGDVTYYFDELEEFIIGDINDPKLFRKKVIYQLFKDIVSILD